jgi:hypothetical protein
MRRIVFITSLLALFSAAMVSHASADSCSDWESCSGGCDWSQRGEYCMQDCDRQFKDRCEQERADKESSHMPDYSRAQPKYDSPFANSCASRGDC